MNILHINTFDSTGGAAILSQILGTEMRKRGHNVRYLVGYQKSHSPYVDDLRGLGVQKQLSYIFPDKIRYILNDTKSFLYANDIHRGSTQEIVHHTWFQEADIIHLHNLHGNYFNLNLLPAISALKPTVWTLHDMWAITGHCAHSQDCQRWRLGCGKCPYLSIHQRQSWDNSSGLWKEKKSIYEHSNIHIVTPSRWLYSKVKSSMLLPLPVSCIHNGIDTEVFVPENKLAAKKALHLPTNKTIVLFVADGGKSNPWKGWSFAKELIRHFRNNPNIFFLCIGGYHNETDIDSPGVRFIPYISDKNKLARYYAASDIFLLTSVIENLPLTVLEALSSGTPVVSFNVGGVCEIVRHKKCGYITQYKNTADLVDGITYFMRKSDKELAHISLLCRKRIQKHFTLKTMGSAYNQLYEKILDTA